MIFQHTWEKVLSGQKTQTRRITREGDVLTGLFTWDAVFFASEDGKNIVYNAEHIRPDTASVWNNGRCRFAVFTKKAVQPGRGQKSVGHILIIGLRREDVRNISEADARAEGFSSVADFLSTWTWMHDKEGHYEFVSCVDDDIALAMNLLDKRPFHLYDAWVLDFKVVQS